MWNPKVILTKVLVDGWFQKIIYLFFHSFIHSFNRIIAHLLFGIPKCCI